MCIDTLKTWGFVLINQTIPKIFACGGLFNCFTDTDAHLLHDIVFVQCFPCWEDAIPGCVSAFLQAALARILKFSRVQERASTIRKIIYKLLTVLQPAAGGKFCDFEPLKRYFPLQKQRFRRAFWCKTCKISAKFLLFRWSNLRNPPLFQIRDKQGGVS